MKLDLDRFSRGRSQWRDCDAFVFIQFIRTHCSWAMIFTCLKRVYFIFLFVKNAMNFNVVIVSFLPSDHRNDRDLLIFAVSRLSFFDANGTWNIFSIFMYILYVLTFGMFLYGGTILLRISTYAFPITSSIFFTYRIQVYSYTVVGFYRKRPHTRNKVFMVLFIRTNFKYRFIWWYYCTENFYIHDFYRSFNTVGSQYAVFDVLVQDCL